MLKIFRFLFIVQAFISAASASLQNAEDCRIADFLKAVEAKSIHFERLRVPGSSDDEPIFGVSNGEEVPHSRNFFDEEFADDELAVEAFRFPDSSEGDSVEEEEFSWWIQKENAKE